MPPWFLTAAVLVLSQAFAADALARPQRNAPARPQAARAAALPKPTPVAQAPKRNAAQPQARRTAAKPARPPRARPVATRAAPAPAARPTVARIEELPEAVAARRARVAEEVRAAARASGFDPATLLAIAMAESSLREHVRNPRSSAAGVLQFSAQTWMAAVPAFAGRIPELAPHAQRLEVLADRERRLDRLKAPPRERRAMLKVLRREKAAAERAILALRHDVRIAARVAAALALEDAGRFRALTGERPSGAGDIYAVHLLGVGAAADLVRAGRQRPEASVAEVLPAPVLRANPEIFLGPDGKTLTVRQARQRIAARIGPVEPVPVQVAAAP